MDRLAELRESQALTLRDLAKKSGVDANTINQVELGHRKPRPSTLRKLAKALDVEVRELFEEQPVLAGKAEALKTGPSLLEKVLDAALQDEAKDSRAMARLEASEGEPQSAGEYEEDKVRAELRALGFPDEYFESFIWPLVVEASQAKRLREKLATLQERQRA